MFGFGEFVDALFGWYTSIITGIIGVLFSVAVPTSDELASDFFTLGIGGTLGAARITVVAIAVFITLIVVLRPTKPHGTKIANTVIGMLMMGVFAWLFYPAYGLLYNLSQGLTKAVVALVTSNADGEISQINALIEGLIPANIIDKFIAGFISGGLSYLVLGEVWALKMLLFAVLILYPIVLALYPLGWFTHGLFHASNSLILVIVLSPPLMALGFALPLILKNIIPLGSVVVAESLVAVIGAAFALLVPIGLFWLAFTTSHRVFGSLESRMSGAIDVATLPPLTLEDMQRDATNTQTSAFKGMVMEVVGDRVLNGAGSDNLVGEVGRMAVNAGATAATAAGYPAAGMAIKVGGGAIVTKIEDRQAQKREAKQPQEEKAGDPEA